MTECDKTADAFLESTIRVMQLLARQRAAIDELASKLGYLPEAHAILEKHGLR
jgi:hypothetical protein